MAQTKEQYVKSVEEVAAKTRDKAVSSALASRIVMFGTRIGHELSDNVRRNPHLDNEQAALTLESFGYYVARTVNEAGTNSPELDMITIGIVCAVAELLGV
jgi:hypothetical protein